MGRDARLRAAGAPGGGASGCGTALPSGKARRSGPYRPRPPRDAKRRALGPARSRRAPASSAAPPSRVFPAQQDKQERPRLKPDRKCLGRQPNGGLPPLAAPNAHGGGGAARLQPSGAKRRRRGAACGGRATHGCRSGRTTGSQTRRSQRPARKRRVVEAARPAETPRVAAPPVAAPRVEAPRVQSPRVQAPRVEAPRVQAPPRGSAADGSASRGSTTRGAPAAERLAPRSGRRINNREAWWKRMPRAIRPLHETVPVFGWPTLRGHYILLVRQDPLRRLACNSV